MFALVYAYNQTKVEYQPPEVFANQTIPILDGFLDGSLIADSLGDYCQPFSSLGEVCWQVMGIEFGVREREV